MLRLVIHHLIAFIFLFCASNIFASTGSDTVISRDQSIRDKLKQAKIVIRSDPKQAVVLLKQAKNLSFNYDEEKYLEAELLTVKIMQSRGELDSAFHILTHSLKTLKRIKNDTLQGMTYHSLGLNYQYKGSLELALEYYIQALEIHETLNLPSKSMKQLNNIGLAYRDEGNYEKALVYLNRCLELSLNGDDRALQSYSYANVGYVFMKQGLYDEALERFNKNLQISTELNDIVTIATANYLIADVYLEQGQFEKSTFHANEALRLSTESSHLLGIIYSNRVLSDVCRLQGDFEAAHEAADIAKRTMNDHQVFLYFDDVMGSLYETEYARGNFKEALNVQLTRSKRKDSLNLIRAKERIANSDFKYQLLINEKETDLLKIESKNNFKTKLFLSILSLLIGLLGLLAYYGYRKSKTYNKSLNLAIDERTKDLLESNKELERFTYITAHDLKEPTRNIVSYSTLINKRIESQNYKAISEYATTLSKNATQLYNLIDRIMIFSSVKRADQLQRTDVHIEKIIKEIQELLSDTFNKQNVSLTHSALPIIKGDRSMILILFKNLIENAIKYNKKADKRIDIGVRGDENEIIYIADNGIGIEEEYQKEIFEMFKKLHPKYEYDGTGLGLSICKRIAHLHNYDIEVENNDESGSTFLLIPFK